MSAPAGPLLIIGAGGHALSVADAALAAGHAVAGFVDAGRAGQSLAGLPIVAQPDDLGLGPDAAAAIAIGDNAVRERVEAALRAQWPGLRFPALVHPAATVSPWARLGEGTVVLAQAVVGPQCGVGRFCIVNTRASLDHEGVLEDFSSLAPGVVTGGRVHIGRRSAVCIGAVLRHGVRLGDDAVLGAGSYLHGDLAGGQLAFGSPARVIRSRRCGDPYLA